MGEIINATNDFAPPIMFMIIDTANKTEKQLIKEIRNQVETEIDKQLEQCKNELTESDYKTVARKLAVERENIIRQFTFQIKNRSKIDSVGCVDKELILA